jgi:hypothetical protein
MRFYSDGMVFRSRVGEEDDDHPIFQEKAGKVFNKILKNEERRLKKEITAIKSRGGKFRKPRKVLMEFTGSEKGWIIFEISLEY